MNRGLRAWVASHTEIKWATAVALLCALLVGAAFFWPTSAPQQAEDTSSQSVRMAVQAPPPAKPAPLPKPATAPAPVKTPTPVKQPAPEPGKAAAPLEARATTPAVTPVKKPATPKKAPTPHTASLSRGYFVQVGSFRGQNHAEALKKRLESHHWPVRIQPKKGSLYAVWVGGYATKAEAEQSKTKLAGQEKLPGFITSR